MLINIKVIPKSSRNYIQEEGGLLKAYLTVAPEKGKANKALIEMLACHYRVNKSSIIIVRGARSHQKVIEVRG